MNVKMIQIYAKEGFSFKIPGLNYVALFGATFSIILM